MHGRSLLLTGLLVLSTGTAAGAATLPARTVVGPEQGVQASVSGTTVTVRFTGPAAAWGAARKHRKVWIECDAHPRPGLLFTSRDGDDAVADALGRFASVRLSADGTSVQATLGSAPGDACVVHAARDASLEASADRAYAALTPAGAAWIDERSHGLRLADVLYASQPRGVYRAAADVVALAGGEVVALDDPNGTPPVGRIGYWSKGRAMSLVGASGAGRRLVLQDLGDGMLRTNVFEALLSWVPPEGISAAALAATRDASGTETDDDADAKYEAPEGVLTQVTGDHVTFRFTGKAARVYRRSAGRRVHAGCFTAPPPPLLGERAAFDADVSMRTVRVPAHGGTIRVTVPRRTRPVRRRAPERLRRHLRGADPGRPPVHRLDGSVVLVPPGRHHAGATLAAADGHELPGRRDDRRQPPRRRADDDAGPGAEGRPVRRLDRRGPARGGRRWGRRRACASCSPTRATGCCAPTPSPRC